ncbi:DUF3307 domain-containing protein [Rhodovulum sp. FJ3]|uniref:DUF3307 domain-containing protein n=1 Tax=Rhodovulum sp. FJ3 TaxID=3079053 RepID=UPI00293DDA1C|nr:DUF3307 domain-containing protein [Rhodovulum sp. FJ3]MDV4167766.1 DUF3307 domain-containing protein [Rhodovulum sp. FJ3]
MIETFIALLMGHVLGDFVVQTRAMVEHKARARMFLLHGVMVLITAMAATGQVARWELLALAAAHMTIDAVKTYLAPHNIAAFLADQGAHLITLIAAAALVPDLWATGLWATLTALPDTLIALMALLTGAIIATRAGGFAVGLLMAPMAEQIDANGLPSGGKLIGLLERGLIYVMILAGQPAGIGFLIAAKSVLRFEATSDEKKAEYVIIGTLASFGWAMITAYATLWVLAALRPLAIWPSLS